MIAPTNLLCGCDNTIKRRTGVYHCWIPLRVLSTISPVRQRCQTMGHRAWRSVVLCCLKEATMKQLLTRAVCCASGTIWAWKFICSPIHTFHLSKCCSVTACSPPRYNVGRRNSACSIVNKSCDTPIWTECEF